MRPALLAAPLCAALAACATAPLPAPAPPPAPVAEARAVGDQVAEERIRRFQFLYGSGEAAVLSLQAYDALARFAREMAANRPRDSVILAADPGAGPARFVPCGDKPLAAIFDVDETVLLNLGYEAVVAEDRDQRGLMERYQASGSAANAPVPGALAAVAAVRAAGIKVIFLSNRIAETRAGTAASLTAAGFGPVVAGDTVIVRGDLGDDTPGKDGRRAAVARTHCVVAMAGDQLGDFADLFNARGLSIAARRALPASGWAAPLWGHGWFLLPNPVYGPALRGTVDELFPADKRWVDPTAAAR